MGSIFVDIAVIIFIAAFMALIFRALKQPLVLSYIVTGLLLGPFAIYQLQNREAMHTFAQLGVTLVLFVLGLELRLKDLKTLGTSILVVGTSQILITGALFFGLARFMEFPYLQAVYLAVAMTFSSTIVIVKLLSEKKDLTSLYGKLSVGILLVQDFVAVAILIVLSGLSSPTATFSTALIAALLFKGIVVIGWVYAMSKTVLPFFLRISARSGETLFLFSLAWVFGLAAIMAAPGIGFSIEIGGFMAGLALANFSENFQIIAKVRSLRDFFITIFFVLLGVDMTFGNIREVFVPALIFSAVVFLLKPYIVMVILGLVGYKKRTAFLTGLTMGQISEFSLIVLFLGKSLGHIPDNLVSFVTLIALFGYGVSSVLIQRGNVLYKYLEPFILFFEGKHQNREVRRDLGDLDDHVVVVGGHQMGQSIVNSLADAKEDIIVVDFDPDIVDKLEKKGVTHLFGDIVDSEIQDIAKLEKARLVISTVPDIEDNLLLIKTLNHENRRAKIIVVAYEKEDAKALYRAGADYVVLPHLAGGMHLAKIIKDRDLSGIEKMKDKDFLELV